MVILPSLLALALPDDDPAFPDPPDPHAVNAAKRTAAAAVVIFFNTGLPPCEPETLTGTANRVTVVTSDRGLAERVQDAGTAVRGARWLLDLRDRTGQLPHAYFGWTEGNPITYLLKFLAFGEGFGSDAPFDDTQARKLDAYLRELDTVLMPRVASLIRARMPCGRTR